MWLLPYRLKAVRVTAVLLVVLFFLDAGAATVGSIGVPTYEQFEFAKFFSQADLVQDELIQAQFLRQVFSWESWFHTDLVGVSLKHGLSYDGHALDPVTGLLQDGGLHNFSAASKEFIHLGLIAWALQGDENALLFFQRSAGQELHQSTCTNEAVVDHLLQLLERKITSYEQFDQQFPGFAGFLPWFTVGDAGIAPTWDWTDRVPALDNGEWAWGLFAVYSALRFGPLSRGEDPRVPPLAARYRARFDLLAANARLVFFNSTDVAFSAVVRIRDVRALPAHDQYISDTPGYYLDDPYEGELFVVLCDLYCDWSDAPQLREQVWVRKRAKLVPVSASFVQPQPVAVQRGFWYSAHEVWKL